MSRVFSVIVVVCLAAGLSACGGGGGGLSTGSSGGSGSSGSGGSGGTTAWTPGLYQPSSRFADKCASPRTGTSDVQGAAVDENNFLRSWTNELYLWYSEVTDVNPALYTTPDYFVTQKTMETTASGTQKDRFHFTYATSVWDSLSQAGVSLGYGALFMVNNNSPRTVTFSYVQAATQAQPSSPALAAGIVRGAAVQSIDNVSIQANDAPSLAILNAALNPVTQGETHTFVILDKGASVARTVTLQAVSFTESPVPLVTTVPVNNTQVGYILFNDHIATSEQALVSAVSFLKTQVIADLVLDIRYNGGGYLDIANELAYMVAGPAPTAGTTFEKIEFNAKNPSTNPVTGEALTPTMFHTTTQGFSTTAGQALPTLNLQRVFVLTGPETCSASESIINSLRGIGVQVIQIGSTTCGKPYGFYPQDNCGTTYFSIQFQGVNNLGFGDYPDGFSPRNTNTTPAPQANVALPGCSVADDFSHPLGDPNESLLSVALDYSTSALCSVAPSGMGIQSIDHGSGAIAQLRTQSPLRQNRILRR